MALWVLVGLVLSAEADVGAGQVGAVATASPIANAARPQPDLGDAVTIEDVEIIARRGAAKLPPVVELDGSQIDAIGAWDINGVLKHLNDFYGGNGEPMVLINGQRVPMASVFYGFPPDAAVRVEVLPPEAAGLYGGRPGQAVYNLVLQPRYASVDLGGAASTPTQGGAETVRLNAQRSSIAGQNSRQLRGSLNRDAGLLNGERDIRRADGVVEDPRASLRPESRMADLGGMMTRQLGSWGTMMSANLRAGENRSTLGVGDILYRNLNRTQAANLSLGLSGQAMGWQLNANGQAGVNQAQTEGFGAGDNRSTTLGLNLSANRRLFSLPAGEVSANLTAGHNRSWSDSERDGVDHSNRSEASNLRAGINLPIIKPGEAGWGRIGGVQADLGLGRQMGGGSQGEDTSLGLAWQPMTKVRLNLSLSESLMGAVEAMRSMPAYYGAPRTVYDFRRGEAVEILPLMGGNPALTAPQAKGMSLNLSAGPFTAWQVSTTLGYNRNESSNGMGYLGDLTDEVQSLFPERFVRGPDGRLIEVDFRPLNMGRGLNEGLNANLNLSVPLAKLWPERFPTQSTLQVRMGGARQLTAVTQLLPGEPDRDQLRGDGGGRSRQDFRLGFDLRHRSVNASVNARWNEGYRSRRLAGVDGPDDLVRQDQWMTDLRLGWQFNRPRPAAASAEGGAPPRRRSAGMELSLDVSNLFDARPEVRLGDGRPAPGYGRDRQDPMGRTLTLNLRRRF